jgi:hypothetical protein
VELSDLAGQGVFKAWEDEKFFAQVHVGPGRQIRWNDKIELCPGAIYLKLTFFGHLWAPWKTRRISTVLPRTR